MQLLYTQVRRKARRGFTLMEAALAIVIVGVGVTAMLQLLAAGTVNNIDSFELTTGMNVARAIREVTLQKSLAQVIAMNGTTHTPPWNSQSQPISDLSGWKQSIAVQAVSPDGLTTNIVDPSPSAVRVTVAVTHNGQQVCNTSWYTFDGTP